MQPPFLTGVLLAALALQARMTQAASDETVDAIPCSAKSPSMGGFYDLRPLAVQVADPEKKPGTGKLDSWKSKGHDYKGNFTLNVCAPVVEDITDVVGIQKSMWRNVSAYYEADGKVFSIGQESTDVKFRGRKLVLQYTGGSPCGPSVDSRSTPPLSKRLASTTLSGEVFEDDDSADKDSDSDKKPKTPSSSTDEDDKDSHSNEKHKPQSSSIPVRRKSTLISFHCEKDPMKAAAVASFIGTDPDECAYFFEVRSEAACAGSEPVQVGLGPGGVFGIIACIAVLVYFIGGVMFNRSVAHARGWRQLPNYSMWASIGSFFRDIFIIATSSCARCIPGREGYRTLSVSANGDSPRGRNRNGRPDDENRLIDQLDEEWDD